MRLLLICILTTFFLTGCKEDKLGLVLSSYNGYKAESLTRIFGAPYETQQLNNGFVQYFGFTDSTYVPPSINVRNDKNSSSGSWGSNKNTDLDINARGGYYRDYSCSLSFFLSQDLTIKSSNYSGNSCARYAKRSYVNPEYILDLPNSYSEIYGFSFRKTKKGIKVIGVKEGSAAARAGLKKGNIISKVNQKTIVALPIEFADDLIRNSNTVTLEVLDKKKARTISFRRSKIGNVELLSKKQRKFLGFN